MNNNNSILLVDPGFDPNTAIHCNLLFKITADSLSYAIVNTGNNRVQVLYDRQDFQQQDAALLNAVHTDPYLKMPFNNVKVCSYTINSISIPNDFYKEAQLDSYAPYFTNLENYASDLNTSTMASQAFKTIFLFPQFIEDTIVNLWPNAARFEQTSPFLALAEKATDTQLVLDFTAGFFYAMLIRNGNLLFQNFYEIADAEELTYYLMLIFKQLQLNPTATDVLVSGILNEGDPQHEILLKYFRSVRWNTPGAQISENTILEDMPAHYYTSLLALQLCE